ncbi:MAG: tetratricopeptide repeat protein [Gemmatimonadetes bacterium]|nr:tetratricopeptide repeat protein [Gemmatimonadota bacterium]
MLRLRTLGVLDLVDDAGRELRSVLAQPKRLALLAYLAVENRRGFQRRDALLGLFWPDLDHDHARHALNQAVHVLRRDLGPRVVVTRGDEELGVDPTGLWCDAAAFERALEAGHLEPALDLYRGDLLEGFFVCEAAEFERWLETTRATLRRRAAAAAWSLAERAEEQEQGSLAAHWARRAVSLAPADEAGLRRLVALLERQGDWTGAVRAYHEFAARLRRDYDLEPSAETRALVDAIRRRAERHVPGAGIEPPKGLRPEHQPGVARARPLARRGLAILGLVALVLGAAAAWAVWVRREARAPPASLTPIAVLPFTVRGSAEYGYLREGMVELLSTKLDGTGGLRAVQPDAVLGALGRTDGEMDPERARALAERLGGKSYIVGSVVEARGRLHLRASLHRGGGDPIAEATVEGEASRVFELVDELTARLFAGTVAGPGARLERLAALTTHSISALKAYLDGESAFRAGRFHTAVEAFEGAVREDTSFALAHYRLALAALWAEVPIIQELQLAERAQRHAHRLPWHDQTLVNAFLDWRRGSTDNAKVLYGGLVAGYPSDVEAWFQLGEALFHYNPPRGLPIVEAREAFERAVFYDARNWGALWHLALLAASERRWNDFHDLVARLTALEPEPDRLLELRVLDALARQDREAERALAPELRSATFPRLHAIAWRAAVYLHDIAGASRIARFLVQPQRDRANRLNGRELLAYLHLAQGRWRAARAELDSLESLSLPFALQARADLAVGSLSSRPLSELRDLREALRRASPAGLGRLWGRDRPWPQVQAHLLGLLSAELGDTAAVLAYAAELERLGEARDARGLTPALAWSLRARILAAEHRPADALRALGEAHPEIWFGATISDPFYSQGRLRYVRAELLRQVGHYHDALRWYRSLGENSPWDLVFLAPSHLRQGEIYELLGDRAKAAEHYERFIALWREADPEFQPLVARAQARLARLGSRS